jgi:hypothetical protein
VLPNPVTTDGNGYYFAYAAAGLVSLQIYYSTVELNYPDQPVGTVAGGSVTSVAITVPVEFTVSGSPITTAGTIAIAKATESANQVYAGPTSGPAAAPAFRALVSADLPGGIGTVSSVGLTVTVPSIFTVAVTGSPITGSGSIGVTIALQTETANTVLAGPTSGGAAPPTFRALVAADVPGLLLQSQTVTFTAAQEIAAAGGTPQTILAGTAGKVNVVFAILLEYKFGSAVFVVTASGGITAGYAPDIAGGNSSIGTLSTGFIDQSVSQWFTGEGLDQAGPLSNYVNQPYLLGANPAGGSLSGGTGGTVIVTIYYTTVTPS